MSVRQHPVLHVLFGFVLFIFCGCAELRGYRYCEAPAPARLAKAAALLSGTGLFADVRAARLAPGVAAYRPRFELWSDGATKRRWVYLPEGTRIDTSDEDAWQFPEGTKLWKEFSRDGVRVETRLLSKVGPAPSDWLAVSYVWRADGTDAVMTPAGQSNARDTPHDVPAARDCMGCHGGIASRVLGFSAIQLENDDTERPDEMSLARLTRERRLSRPLTRALRVPGDP
ncbi:MAG: hypothetical protein K0S65_2230, partial [Labilithrix sp.]|nr:hypothetical protein [Labilithrix sp.]